MEDLHIRHSKPNYEWLKESIKQADMIFRCPPDCKAPCHTSSDTIYFGLRFISSYIFDK